MKQPYFLIREDTGTLQLTYSHKGKLFRINSHIKCTAEQWDDKTQLKKGAENAKDNINLTTMLNRIKGIIFEYQKANGSDYPDIDTVKREWHRPEQEKIKDRYIIEDYKQWLQRKSQEIKPSGVKHYNTLLNNLELYEQMHHFQLRYSDMDEVFYNNLTRYYIKSGISNHTIRKRIKCLKCYLTESKNTNESYKKWDIKKFKVVKRSTVVCLTKSELQKLWQYKFEGTIKYFDEELQKEVTYKAGSRLQYYADLYLLGASVGLRYNDLIRISSENIKGDNLVIWINKTDTEPISIPLNPISKHILSKYNNTLEKVSNVKINEHLKVVFKVIGLWEKVTMLVRYGNTTKPITKGKWDWLTIHTARKTFATQAIQEGIPVKTVMKWTNHSDVTVFMENYVNENLNQQEQMNKMYNGF